MHQAIEIFLKKWTTLFLRKHYFKSLLVLFYFKICKKFYCLNNNFLQLLQILICFQYFYINIIVCSLVHILQIFFKINWSVLGCDAQVYIQFWGFCQETSQQSPIFSSGSNASKPAHFLSRGCAMLCLPSKSILFDAKKKNHFILFCVSFVTNEMKLLPGFLSHPRWLYLYYFF